MDSNWRPVQGCNAPAGGVTNVPAIARGDEYLHALIKPEARSRIVNKPVQGCNTPAGVDPNAPADVDKNVPAIAGGDDWRALIKPEARSRIVDKLLMESFKKYLLVSEPGRLGNLKAIAVRCEQRIYTAAVNLDYLDYLLDGTNSRLLHVQNRLAVLNKRAKGGCSCMSLLLPVVAIVILVVIVWLFTKYP